MNSIDSKTEATIKNNLKTVAEDYLKQAQVQFPEEKFKNPFDALTRILISSENNAYRA